jgi:hypothetical protein
MPLIRSRTLFVVGVLTLSASACKDQEKCDEAIRVTREAINKEQTDVARQWRDRAWKMCDDPATVANLDKEILAKEEEVKKRAEDEAKKVADAAQARMEKAGKVWKKFDKLEDDDKTLSRLDKHRETAERMTKGLPDDYKKQIEKFNDKQYKRRKDRLEDED